MNRVVLRSISINSTVLMIDLLTCLPIDLIIISNQGSVVTGLKNLGKKNNNYSEYHARGTT